MSAPWLKFFPSDWRADPSLRMCSIAARGLWIEMLCVMHEAVPRGTLRVNGKTVSDKQLAILSGCHDVEKLLEELEEAGVFSREADGTIFSRRMMRDVEKAEQDKANGRKGGNPKLKGGVNPNLNGVDKAQKPEARTNNSSSLRSEETRAQKPSHLRAEFDREFWPVYPNRVGKPKAMEAFVKARSKADLATIMSGLHRYVAKTDDRAWCNPATWLNQERWDDQPAQPPQRAQPPPKDRTIFDAIDDFIRDNDHELPAGKTIDHDGGDSPANVHVLAAPAWRGR